MTPCSVRRSKLTEATPKDGIRPSHLLGEPSFTCVDLIPPVAAREIDPKGRFHVLAPEVAILPDLTREVSSKFQPKPESCLEHVYAALFRGPSFEGVPHDRQSPLKLSVPSSLGGRVFIFSRRQGVSGGLCLLPAPHLFPDPASSRIHLIRGRLHGLAPPTSP